MQYKCSICSMTYTTLESLSQHIEKHRPDKPYLCNQCEKNFDTIEDLKTHTGIYHKYYYCRQCGINFRVMDHFRRHMEIHNDSKCQNQCNYCGAAFMDNSELISHIYIQHSDLNVENASNTGHFTSKDLDSQESPCKCSQCDLFFANDKILRKHVIKDHNTMSYDISIGLKINVSNEPIINIKTEQMECETDSLLETKIKINDESHNSDISVADLLIEPKVEIKEELEDIMVQTGIVIEGNMDKVLTPTNFIGEGIFNVDLYNPCNRDSILLSENDKQDYVSLQTSSQNEDPLSLNYFPEKIPYEYNQSEQFHQEGNYMKENVEVNTGQIPFLYQNDQSHSKEQVAIPNCTTLYQCKICKDAFLNIDCLNKHMRKKHFNGKKHVAIPNGRKLYQCKHCSIVFWNIIELNIHMEMHFEERYKVTVPNRKKLSQVFKCNQCNLVFRTVESLTSHMKSHPHIKEKDCVSSYSPIFPQCKQCNKVFNSIARLNAHIKTHIKEKVKEKVIEPNITKVYQCKKCNIIFLNTENLKKHIKTHIHGKEHGSLPVEDKHQCKQCSKIFLDDNALAYHMTTQCQEKEYVAIPIGKRLHKCKHCEKVFLDDNYLRLHMTTHIQENSRKCSQCDLIFANNKILRRHIINDHIITNYANPGGVKIQNAEIRIEDNVESYLTHEINKNKNFLYIKENDKSNLEDPNIRKVQGFVSDDKKVHLEKSKSDFLRVDSRLLTNPSNTLQQHRKDMIKGAEIVFNRSEPGEYKHKDKTNASSLFNKEDMIQGAKMVYDPHLFYNYELDRNITDQELYMHMKEKYIVKKVQIGVKWAQRDQTASRTINTYCQFPKDLVRFNQSEHDLGHVGEGDQHPLHQYYYDKYVAGK